MIPKDMELEPSWIWEWNLKPYVSSLHPFLLTKHPLNYGDNIHSKLQTEGEGKSPWLNSEIWKLASQQLDSLHTKDHHEHHRSLRVHDGTTYVTLLLSVATT